ncbi:MAG TPA: hypothetical protein VGS21_09950, partial [Acidimicrobiales bacterium]|nr:hypothetical protein [Acidimicrobiales bacterium]
MTKLRRNTPMPALRSSSRPGLRARTLAAVAAAVCLAPIAITSEAGAAPTGTRPTQAIVGKVVPIAYLQTVAGSPGSGRASLGQQPIGLAVGPGSTGLLIADQGANAVRFLSSTGSESVDVGNGVPDYNGDGRPPTTASLIAPTAVAVDHAHDVVFADTYSDRVRIVAAANCASHCEFGLPSTVAGDVYTVAGNGASGPPTSGGPAIKAALNGPVGVAIDPSGDIVFADSYSNVVRLVANASCSSNCPYGLASTVAGDIYTVAGTANGTYGFTGDGGAATSAELAAPQGIAIDAAGDIVVADSGVSSVQLVAWASCASACRYGLAPINRGDIYDLAGGSGVSGFSGDNGPGPSAHLGAAAGVGID